MKTTLGVNVLSFIPIRLKQGTLLTNHDIKTPHSYFQHAPVLSGVLFLYHIVLKTFVSIKREERRHFQQKS